jgi:hypothetical protein
MRRNSVTGIEATKAGSGIDRRVVLRGVAWSLPVIALAAATPARAASVSDVGAFALGGSCGTIGILGPGFTLTAASAPLPVGTILIITGAGVSNIGVFTVSGGSASVVALSGTSRLITLTAELPADATMSFRTTLPVGSSFTLDAVVSLPSEYVGTGSKSAGSVSSTTQFCIAN